MGDLLESFLGKYASEDKVRWENSCWSVGIVVDPKSHRYNWYQSLDPPGSMADG